MKFRPTLVIVLLFQFFWIIKITNISLPLAPLTILLPIGALNLLANVKNLKRGIPLKISVIFIIYILLKALAFYVKTGIFIGVGSMIEHVCVLIYILNCSILVSGNYTRILIRFFFLITTISLIFGLLIFIFGSPFTELRLSLLEIDITNRKYDREGIITGQGLPIAGFSSTVAVFSYVLCVLVIFALYFSETKKGFLFYSIVALSVIGLLINGERAALIFALIGMAIFIRKEKPVKLVIGLTSFALLVFMISNQITYSTAKHRTGIERLLETSLAQNEDDIVPRLTRQAAGIITVIQNPVFGATHYDYLKVKSKYFPQDDYTKVSNHNSYINVGLDTGFGGLVLLTILFVYLVKLFKWFRLQSHYLTDHEYRIFQLLEISLVVTLLNGFFHNDGILNSCEASSVVLLGILVQFFSTILYEEK